MNARSDKFIVLANNRVNKLIKQLKLVGNLSNKSHYDYSEDDAKKIITAIESEVRNLKQKFLKNKKNKLGEFKL